MIRVLRRRVRALKLGDTEQQIAAEMGDTLVEVLLALVVIGLTVVAILGAFATTLSATTEQRTLASADAVLRSFAETATYVISLSSTPAFVACPSSTPSAYSTLASQYTSSHAPTGYTVAITSVSNLSSSCSTSAPSPQLITAKVTSTSGANDSLSFVVSQPDQNPTTISTAVTSISPTFGPAAGGTKVYIYGSGFTGATSVDFGPTAATSFTVNSDTQITAYSPAGTGLVDVTVTSPQGTTTTTIDDEFTYAPTVTGISPATGTPSGGTAVTITGTGFIGSLTVDFGTTAATVVDSTQSQIDVTSPAGAGVVDVTVTTAAGTSTTSSADQFTYGLSVTGISPSSGPDTGGTSVSIAGSGFTGATAVKFGTTAATKFTYKSPTSITATAPPGTGVVDVTVTTPSGGTSATSPADQFTYQPGPVVGLGLVIKSGTKSPVASCDKTSGTSCASPNAGTCVMTGTSNTTTCDITGIWQGSGSSGSSVTFYVETVDAAGNPVVYSTTNSLTLAVAGATTDVTPFTIPPNTATTDPHTVTAVLLTSQGTTTVTITGATYTLIVKVSK